MPFLLDHAMARQDFEMGGWPSDTGVRDFLVSCPLFNSQYSCVY